MSDNKAFWKIMKQKMEELNQDTRYIAIIFEKLNKLSLVDDEKLIIYDCLNSLWKASDKTPSFESMITFEDILQRDGNYRDHFIHSFNVFLLGYYIMNGIKKYYSDVEYNKKNPFLYSNDPNLTWMLTSTFHDFAYPIQNIDEWINDLLKIYIGINPHLAISIPSILPPIYEQFFRQISALNKNPLINLDDTSTQAIDWNFYNCLCEKLCEKDHGVYSGIILAHQLAIRENFFESYPRLGDFKNLHLPACHAICRHTMDQKIFFKKHHFAFLLMICDELQDWGRTSQNKDRDILKILDVSISESNGNPIVDIKIDASADRINKLKKRNYPQNF